MIVDVLNLKSSFIAKELDQYTYLAEHTNDTHQMEISPVNSLAVVDLGGL